MTLEFLNGDRMDVLNIFGSPNLIHGVMRDTLAIECDPSVYTFEFLQKMFKDNLNTGMLYTYDADGKKILIGKGYGIFVSLALETKQRLSKPGELSKPILYDVYVAKMAQMTYDEFYDENTRLGQTIDSQSEGDTNAD